MSGAPEDSAGDARLDALLTAMRAYHAGETSARVPVVPGESGRDGELCRLFNAIADRSALLERYLGQEPRTGSAQREGATSAVSATHGRVTAVVGSGYAAIAVFEDDSAPETSEPMGKAALAAVRGLGGAWERATVLRIRSDEDVRAALEDHDIVCALLDARLTARSALSPSVDHVLELSGARTVLSTFPDVAAALKG